MKKDNIRHLILVFTVILSAVVVTSCGNKQKSNTEEKTSSGGESKSAQASSSSSSGTVSASSPAASSGASSAEKSDAATSAEIEKAKEAEKKNDDTVSVKRQNAVSGTSSKSSGGKTEQVIYPTAVTDKNLTKYWNIIDAVAEAGQVYYNDNFSKTSLITENGYLYNAASKDKVDVAYLIKKGYLASKYADCGCDVLLLNCSDFDRYDTVSLKNSEEGLTVFVALKNPENASFLVATSKSMGGSLSASQYYALLNGYSQNHGSVSRLFSNTDTYNRILSFISMYEAKYEDYCVRNINIDNKYAFVTLSSASNTNDVKEYILKKSNSIWEVVYGNVEKEPRMLIAVNKKLPDFNIEMLPACGVYSYRGSIRSSNIDIVKKLAEYGFIQSNSDITYFCETQGYAYIVLKNEVKILCVMENDQWKPMQMASGYDAEKKMLSISSSAPVFIVLDK